MAKEDDQGKTEYSHDNGRNSRKQVKTETKDSLHAGRGVNGKIDTAANTRAGNQQHGDGNQRQGSCTGWPDSIPDGHFASDGCPRWGKTEKQFQIQGREASAKKNREKKSCREHNEQRGEKGDAFQTACPVSAPEE